MPQIGWFEIILIAAIAIIIIGPKDFPVMLKKIGSWIGTIKRYFSTLQKEVSLYENENFDTDDSKKKKFWLLCIFRTNIRSLRNKITNHF